MCAICKVKIASINNRTRFFSKAYFNKVCWLFFLSCCCWCCCFVSECYKLCTTLLHSLWQVSQNAFDAKKSIHVCDDNWKVDRRTNDWRNVKVFEHEKIYFISKWLWKEKKRNARILVIESDTIGLIAFVLRNNTTDFISITFSHSKEEHKENKNLIYSKKERERETKKFIPRQHSEVYVWCTPTARTN